MGVNLSGEPPRTPTGSFITGASIEKEIKKAGGVGSAFAGGLNGILGDIGKALTRAETFVSGPLGQIYDFAVDVTSQILDLDDRLGRELARVDRERQALESQIESQRNQG